MAIQVKYLPENGHGYLEYDQEGNTIDFEDGEITLNLKKRERDYDVLLDVCEDSSGGLVIAVHGAELYRAQIFIPAREYTEEEVENPDYDPEDEGSQQTITTQVAVPFDITKCVLTLWGKEA